MIFCQNADRLADYLAKNNITPERYAWNIDKKKYSGSFFVVLDGLVNMIYAILMASFGYNYEEEHGPIKKGGKPIFVSPEDIQSGNVPPGFKLQNTYISK